MNKKILVDGSFPNKYRVALVGQNNIIEDLEYQSSSIPQIKGNIYLAKIARIEPGLQAAFIDYGGEKNGFLPFSEIHPSYYNIPVADMHQNDSSLDSLKAISYPSELKDEINEQVFAIENTKNYNGVEEDIDIDAIEKLIDEDENQAHRDSDNYLSDISNEDTPSPIPLYKQYQIQEVIKKGQIILVQVQKEERGNKGASFTSYISLAGKYCVLMPNSPGHQGVSRKIQSSEERRRLKYLISQLMTEADMKVASVIVRTAGVRRPANEIKKDYEYLVNLWNKVRESTLRSIAPTLVHVEDGIIQKTIRDIYDATVNQIIIEGEEAYNSAIEFGSNLLSHDMNKAIKHDKLVPIFSYYNIEDQISDLYKQSVSLPSGGYIIINPTEALTAIDVNSGKSISERSIEETALKTNVEAAKEIARQLKIRDISGLIVIDFIDMNENRNKKIVERSLREFVSKDKAKIQMGNISTFGLLEMSRQRLRPSFLESHTKMCNQCNGKGIVRDDEANSIVILRTIENEVSDSDVDIINLYASINTVLYILNNKRIEIDVVEDKHGIKLNFVQDTLATADSFSIEKISLDPYEPKPILENRTNSSKDFDFQPRKKSKIKKALPSNENLEVNLSKEVLESPEEKNVSNPNNLNHNITTESPPKKPSTKKPIAKRRNWKNAKEDKDSVNTEDKPSNAQQVKDTSINSEHIDPKDENNSVTDIPTTQKATKKKIYPRRKKPQSED